MLAKVYDYGFRRSKRWIYDGEWSCMGCGLIGFGWWRLAWDVCLFGGVVGWSLWVSYGIFGGFAILLVGLRAHLAGVFLRLGLFQALAQFCLFGFAALDVLHVAGRQLQAGQLVGGLVGNDLVLAADFIQAVLLMRLRRLKFMVLSRGDI